VDSQTVSTEGHVTARATITNTGDRAGGDVVQLYYSDPVAEVARPVIMLLGFARVELDPGQSATVEFDISTDRFAYCGRSGERVVDAGDIELKVGHSSAQIVGRSLIRLSGPARAVGFDRTLTTPVDVTTAPLTRNVSSPT
jgi:beta-xylosidase